MAVYLVILDLDRIGRNYTLVRKKLVALDALQAQGAVWFVKHEGPARDLRDHLQDCLGNNDRLFVSLISSDWSSFNMTPSSRWLRDQASSDTAE